MEEMIDVLDECGLYTNRIASRKECTEKGLWHRVCAIFILNNDNNKVLLQKRSSDKKIWPDLWDVSVGGHVNSGELSNQAIIRELKEEIGLDFKKEDVEFIGSSTSTGKHNHYNEFYVIHLDINPQNLTLQKEEVQNVRWFSIDEVKERLNNNCEGITPKIACWNHLFNYVKMQEPK